MSEYEPKQEDGDAVVDLPKINKADAEWRLIRAELFRAIERRPAFHSAHEGYGAILDELAKLWDEMCKQYDTQGRRAAIRKEATQVAAMTIRFLIDVCDD